MQNAEDEASPATNAALDEEITRLQEEVAELKAVEKKARAELSVLASKPVLSEIRQDVGHLEKEREALLERLSALRGKRVTEISPEEQAKVTVEWKQWQRHAGSRKRICRELWNLCSEVLPENMTRQELWVCSFPSIPSHCDQANSGPRNLWAWRET